tara:strand:+ start:41213 stop:41713 length:501 start_codon:yes stop_codon:yes gene_type:complete
MSYKTMRLAKKGMYTFTTDSNENIGFLGGTTHVFGISADSDSIIKGDLDVGTDSDSEIRCTGDIIAFSTSDIKLKTDVTPITNPISKIQQLSGNTFTWKPAAGKRKVGIADVGVIAQEVNSVLPDITREVDGVMSVRYEKLIPLLIECVKDQQTQIDELKLKLEDK